MKSVEVYRTKKNYKILTQYELESGSYISSNPIFILSLDTDTEEIANRIFEALDSSRLLSESEEDDFWLGNKLLKEIKESSFDKFYQSSTSCRISKQKDFVIIAPRKYLGRSKGLFTEEKQALKVRFDGRNKNETTAEVIKLLQDVPPAIQKSFPQS